MAANFSDHKNKLIMGVGSGPALSMKTNNLKYHLMRDLLQKKTLEEIMQLKQRLLQTAEPKSKSSGSRLGGSKK